MSQNVCRLFGRNKYIVFRQKLNLLICDTFLPFEKVGIKGHEIKQ